MRNPSGLPMSRRSWRLFSLLLYRVGSRYHRLGNGPNRIQELMSAERSCSRQSA